MPKTPSVNMQVTIMKINKIHLNWIIYKIYGFTFTELFGRLAKKGAVRPHSRKSFNATYCFHITERQTWRIWHTVTRHLLSHKAQKLCFEYSIIVHFFTWGFLIWAFRSLCSPIIGLKGTWVVTYTCRIPLPTSCQICHRLPVCLTWGLGQRGGCLAPFHTNLGSKEE